MLETNLVSSHARVTPRNAGSTLVDIQVHVLFNGARRAKPRSKPQHSQVYNTALQSNKQHTNHEKTQHEQEDMQGVFATKPSTGVIRGQSPNKCHPSCDNACASCCGIHRRATAVITACFTDAAVLPGYEPRTTSSGNPIGVPRML